MYPFKTDQSIVRNRWYIAAFSSEISRTPMERTLLGVPVALYRTEAGKPVAMYGLCPHRYYPLALGKLEGDALVCGYHGFTFDADGKCISIPSQGTGAGFCQPTYPIEERGPLCWIWMGDRDRCDPDLIPPYDDFGLDQPGWHNGMEFVLHMKGRYQLLVDNLMDLTHLPYVHSQIAGGDAFKMPPFEIEERNRSLRITRTSTTPWTGYYEFLFGADKKFDGMCVMKSITDFYGPELVRTSGPIITSIEGMEDVPDGIGEVYFMHGITPETETTTHYWSVTPRNFRMDDRALDEMMAVMDREVRQQDVDAIDAVEVRLEGAARIQKELLAKSDLPAVRVRQKVQAMLDAEVA